MRILIFGGTGYIGGKLSDALRDNHDLVFLCNTSKPLKTDLKDTVYYGSVLCREDVEKCFEQMVDMVVVLIGQQTENRQLFRDINIDGNSNIISIMHKKNVQDIVVISSSNVYGERDYPITDKELTCPKSYYGIIKRQVEKLYEKEDSVILRFGNVYGGFPRKGLIPNIKNAIKNNSSLNLPVNDVIRDFIHIDDAVDAIIRVIEEKKKGIYNIAAEKFSIYSIVSMFEEFHNLKIQKLYRIEESENIITMDTNKVKEEIGFFPDKKIEDFIRKTGFQQKVL